MKKKKIIFSIILIIIITSLTIASFSVYIVKKLQYTSDGAVIIIPGETNTDDLPPNTKMVLAVESPDDSEYDDNVEVNNQRSKITQKDFSTPDNSPSTDFEISDEEIEENPYLKILMKYNDKEEILELYKNLYLETYGIHTVNEEKTPVTDTQIRLYEITVGLTERVDVSQEDKSFLEEYLNDDSIIDIKNAYNEQK